MIELTKKSRYLVPILALVPILKSNNMSAYQLDRVCVEENRFVVMDGSMLLVVNLEHEFPVGLYRVVSSSKTKVTLDLDSTDLDLFPDYKGNILHFFDEFQFTTLPKYCLTTPDAGYAAVIRALPKNFIAHKYWNLIAPIVDCYAIAAKNPDVMPILFCSGDGKYQAVIMSIMP